MPRFRDIEKKWFTNLSSRKLNFGAYKWFVSAQWKSFNEARLQSFFLFSRTTVVFEIPYYFKDRVNEVIFFDVFFFYQVLKS